MRGSHIVILVHSFDAKEREPLTGQVSWLTAIDAVQTAFPSPLRIVSALSGTVTTMVEEHMNCSPMTVARLRRNCTDFPILPE
ncbi:hypothetical protein KSZ_73750 [Dictyobacter formicarum]|uniref:Uncharacterized protein n=1 Tax=Dictyobacter formicarum TaxID=2778368 RepID=A0ABQ3VSW5_9CHLR|nr:hypothetical protein KSZ_73750 [Dictyobacter formicarum]